MTEYCDSDDSARFGLRRSTGGNAASQTATLVIRTMALGELTKDAIPRLMQRELWPDYQGPEQDSLVLEIYHHWLRPA